MRYGRIAGFLMVTVCVLSGIAGCGAPGVTEPVRESPALDASSDLTAAFHWVGAQMQAAARRNDADVALATVAGEAVTVQDVLDQLALLQGNAMLAGQSPGAPTLTDAFDRTVLAKAHVAEARRRGLVVTDAEIAGRVTSERRSLASAPAETRDVFTAELAARGLTEDEFWEQEKTRYETVLLLMKLREQFADENGQAAVDEAAYAAFLANLQAAAAVQLLEPDYLAQNSIVYYSAGLGVSFGYPLHFGTVAEKGSEPPVVTFDFHVGELAVARLERSGKPDLAAAVAESIRAHEEASSGRLRHTNLGETMISGFPAGAIYLYFDSAAGRTDSLQYIVHTAAYEYRVSCQTKPGPPVQSWDEVEPICHQLLKTLVIAR